MASVVYVNCCCTHNSVDTLDGLKLTSQQTVVVVVTDSVSDMVAFNRTAGHKHGPTLNYKDT